MSLLAVELLQASKPRRVGIGAATRNISKRMIHCYC
jgi:hypothetical protein